MDASRRQSYTLAECLRYYIVRESHMVPLAPVDQLPFQLQGVPRHLSHRQMLDDGWKYVTEVNELPSQIPVQSPSPDLLTNNVSSTTNGTKPRYFAPDYQVRREPSVAPAEYGVHDQAYIVLPADKVTVVPSYSISVEQPSTLADSVARIYGQDAERIGCKTPYPSGIEPDQAKKEYCTHWIKTGECAFLSIGCKYKHEMPTVEKLHELGFTQGMPRWWKEKTAITARSATWMQRRLAEAGHGESTTEDTPRRKELLDMPSWNIQEDRKSDTSRDRQLRDLIFRKESPFAESTAAPTAIPVATLTTKKQAGSVTIPNLIDLDDYHNTPPSTGPSRVSVSSEYSIQATPSSNLDSTLTYSMSESKTVQLLNKKAAQPSPYTERSDTPVAPLPQRASVGSWGSSSDDDAPPSKPAHPSQKRRITPRKAPKRNPGLAQSRHAAKPENQHVAKQAKNLSNYNKNASRKIQAPKGKGSEVVEARPREIHNTANAEATKPRSERVVRASVA